MPRHRARVPMSTLRVSIRVAPVLHGPQWNVMPVIPAASAMAIRYDAQSTGPFRPDPGRGRDGELPSGHGP